MPILIFSPVQIIITHPLTCQNRFFQNTTLESAINIPLCLLKFIYSEKATKFCEISTLLLTVCTVVKSKVKIAQNDVAFSEYMNFTLEPYLGDQKLVCIK